MTEIEMDVTLWGDETFKAMVDPRDTWNGWLQPRFPKSEAERVAAFSNRMAVEYPADQFDSFEWDGDILVQTSHNGDEVFGPYRIEPDDEGFYGIGDGSWTWAAASEFDTGVSESENRALWGDR